MHACMSGNHSVTDDLLKKLGDHVVSGLLLKLQPGNLKKNLGEASQVQPAQTKGGFATSEQAFERMMQKCLAEQMKYGLPMQWRRFPTCLSTACRHILAAFGVAALLLIIIF